MAELSWGDKMEALARKHYTPQQLQKLRAPAGSPQDQDRYNRAWLKLHDDIRALGKGADPKQPKALELARTAQALMEEMAQGDPALLKAIVAFNREATQDMHLVWQTPGLEFWPFIDQALVELKVLQPKA